MIAIRMDPSQTEHHRVALDASAGDRPAGDQDVTRPGLATTCASTTLDRHRAYTWRARLRTPSHRSVRRQRLAGRRKAATCRTSRAAIAGPRRHRLQRVAGSDCRTSRAAICRTSPTPIAGRHARFRARLDSLPVASPDSSQRTTPRHVTAPPRPASFAGPRRCARVLRSPSIAPRNTIASAKSRRPRHLRTTDLTASADEEADAPSIARPNRRLALWKHHLPCVDYLPAA